jgi:8-oxo-dGTP pyrophosphatase MutT (NUDIX family)
MIPVKFGRVNMNQTDRHCLLNNPGRLLHKIESRLAREDSAADWMRADGGGIRGSAVLFLLTECRAAPGKRPELCLLLNKRSRQVLQPGDLCCPGGGITRVDRVVSGFMPPPVAALHKWPRWFRWRLKQRQAARRVMQAWTAGLREAWEEIRLNPLKVTLLGLLPVQQLTMFRRLIFPLTAWVPAYPRLKPNWEVDRVINVPLRRLLDPENYGRYRLSFQAGQPPIGGTNEYPCFIHHGRQGTEILWGATFRITMDFLRIALDFNYPAMEVLPVVWGKRDTTYLNGSVWDPAPAGRPGR